MTKKEFRYFVSPSVIIMFLLAVVPLVFTIYLSFQSYTYGSTPQFIGFANYISVLKNSRFWNSLNFTLLVTVVTTIVKLILAFGIALLLYRLTNNKLKNMFVAGSMLPFIVTPVVGTLIFAWMFKEYGVLTYFLSLLGIEIQWYASAQGAKTLVMLHWIWSGVAFGILVLFAGLQAMTKEPLEAAIIDGASWFQRIKYVVIPQLSSLFLFIAMMDVMDAYRLFDSISVMTKGGPGTATETLTYYNYNVAFHQLNLGQGSAISILTVLGIFILMIPFLYFTYKEQVSK